MEFIEQWWASDPWFFSVIIASPIILFILWKLFARRRYDDEIYLSDKDLYNHQYFDESPAYKNNEIVDHSVLEFEKNNPSVSADTQITTDAFDDGYGEPEYSDWEQVRANEVQKQDESFSKKAEHAETSVVSETDSASPPLTEESPQKDRKKPKELIIAINIRSNQEEGFKGTDIFEAMEQLGIEHGNMSIFHHYGIEKEPTEYPVFSIANLVKPGTFNPAEQDTFSTPGLIAFLQLPCSLGGRVAFELMLHYTQRLADMLQGHLEDDRKQLVDAELIDFMRKGIDEFEHDV